MINRFNPLNYSPLAAFNYPGGFGVPIGGYPQTFARSALMGSLNGLGPIAPLGGINPLSFSALPFLAGALKGDQKLLSRSSSVYEPSVMGNGASYLQPSNQPPMPSGPIPFPVMQTAPIPMPHAPTLTAHSISTPMHMSASHEANAYSVNGTSPVSDRPMSTNQGDLIKQQLRDHYLSGVRWQLMRALREQALKDQQMREQYVKELRAKSMLSPLSYLDMYEEVKKKK
jgi:hypothetical protein